MSSKHDSDNRSNQLNPNNSAYSSSRSWTGRDAEDEGDSHGTGGSSDLRYRNLLAAALAEHVKPSDHFRIEFDLISLNGTVSLFEFTAELPSRPFVAIKDMRDSADVARHVLERLKSSTLRETRHSLAFCEARHDDQKEIPWLGYEYSPSLSSTTSRAGLEARELWNNFGERAVINHKNDLKNGTSLIREDLGVISPKTLYPNE